MKLDKYKLITASLVGITACSGLAMASAYADTPASSSSSANASVTVSNTINLTLAGGDLLIDNLTPGNASDSNIITATITSNSPYGYHLSATTGTSSGTTSLVNTADNNFSFTNLNTNKATLNDFSDNTWGYSYSTDNGTSWISGDYGTALAGYNGLILDNDDSGATGTTLYDNDSYAGSTAVKFKIGAKSASTQAAGTYTGTVNFYAVTNPGPDNTMQGFAAGNASTTCTAMSAGDTLKLKDSRDNQEYTIAKLADNKCWMVENLNLAGGTALDADKTDVASAYIEDYTTSNNLIKDDSNNTIVLPTSASKDPSSNYFTDNTQFSTNNNAYVFNSGNKPSCTDSIQSRIPCYSYYSWDAATLGSGRTLSSDIADAPYSICPKGWKLPTSRNNGVANWQTVSDFYVLAHQYGLDSTTSTSEYSSDFYNLAGPGTTPDLLLAGYAKDGSFHDSGINGGYWSSTSYSSTDNAYNLGFSSNSVNTSAYYYRRVGYSVRCLLR